MNNNKDMEDYSQPGFKLSPNGKIALVAGVFLFILALVYVGQRENFLSKGEKEPDKTEISLPNEEENSDKDKTEKQDKETTEEGKTTKDNEKGSKDSKDKALEGTPDIVVPDKDKPEDELTEEERYGRIKDEVENMTSEEMLEKYGGILPGMDKDEEEIISESVTLGGTEITRVFEKKSSGDKNSFLVYSLTVSSSDKKFKADKEYISNNLYLYNKKQTRLKADNIHIKQITDKEVAKIRKEEKEQIEKEENKDKETEETKSKEDEKGKNEETQWERIESIKDFGNPPIPYTSEVGGLKHYHVVLIYEIPFGDEFSLVFMGTGKGNEPLLIAKDNFGS